MKKQKVPAKPDKLFDYKLLFVFLAVAAQILIMSYGNYKGGLTADSKNYFFLAQNILDGHGFWVRDFYSSTGRSYFAVWPVGYSLLIAGFAKVLPVDLVLASKLVNIFLIGLVFLVFRKIFGKEAYLFGSVFFLDSVMKLTYRTWVQAPFIVGFILLSIVLYKFYYNRKDIKWVAAIILLGILLFLIRYDSLTSLIAIGLLGCFLFYKKDYRSFFLLAFAGFVILGFAGFYLYMNYLNTGYPTGMERIGNPEEPMWMIKRLVLRLLDEMKSPGVALLLAAIWFKFSGYDPAQKADKDKNTGKLWPFFVLVGLTHLLFIIALRFNMRFDDFGGRMFGPVTILMVIALLDYLRANSKYYVLFKNSLMIVLISTLLYNAPIKTAISLYQGDPHYSKYRRMAAIRYSGLQPNSIVLFADYDLIYLRNDVQPASPFPFYGDYIYGKEYDGDLKEDIGKDESIMEYTNRRCKLNISAIYMDILNWKIKRRKEGYNAVEDFIKKHPDHNMIKIADCLKIQF